MDQAQIRGIARAKELLKLVRHAAMATVNEDGSPHNTPFMFLRAPDLSRVYWGSHPESVHSRNVLRTGQAFIVLYDAVERGGLFMRTDDIMLLEGAGLEAALMVHNQARLARGLDALTAGYYLGESPQRMWSATPRQWWVNGSRRDAQGHIERDVRYEVQVRDLLE